MKTMTFFQTYRNLLDISFSSTVAAVILILISIIYWIKTKRILPGPRGLPYLGLYPFLTNDNAFLKLEEYKKKYGDMFSFTFTGKLFVNLGSIKAMREIQVQKSDCFVDRYKDSSIFTQMMNNGLLFVNGEPWKILRKFFIQKFKEYGLNAVRDDLAGPVYDSLNTAIVDLKKLNGKPVNISEFLSEHCAITIRKIMFGEKGVTNQEISKMVMAFLSSLEVVTQVNTLIMGPIAKFFYYTNPNFRKSLKQACIMKSIILDCVKRIESSVNGDEATSIIEAFYKERNKRKRNNDPSWVCFTDAALVESLFQFIGDGIASTASFIALVFNIFLEHSAEQEKVYSEIIDVIGSNRQPTVEDRPKLPYTNAFLHECVRTSRFMTFFASLQCTKETTVRGYKIPAGSVTLLNFWSAHHDEETFEDPYAFKPSRYMQSEGNPKAELPVLFGMGKRICTGEPYVMLQAFLFLTTIVKNFKVESSSAANDDKMDFLEAGKLELCFVRRKDI